MNESGSQIASDWSWPAGTPALQGEGDDLVRNRGRSERQGADGAVSALATGERPAMIPAGTARPGRSLEHRSAFARVRELAAPGRFRVKADAEGWPIIPGKLGQIEWHCDGVDCHACPLPGVPALAVYTDRRAMFRRVLAVPGVRRHQAGEGEMRAVFPVEALSAVAAVIRARRRRLLSEAEVEARRGRLARAQAGATSGAQHATSTAMLGSGTRQSGMQATGGS